METKLMVLCNVFNGLFITHTWNQDAFDDRSNPRVPAYTEIIVLKEYANAVFVRLDPELERAETSSFYFYKYTEDQDDGITWVEPKGMELLPE